MEILILGESGVGKSVMGDEIKKFIFKEDPDATILTDDADREMKKMGDGKNIYNIHVRQTKENKVDLNPDITILIHNREFKKWQKEVI